MTYTDPHAHEGSEFLNHRDCPSCGSSDANSVYTDGHTYCFSCGAYSSGEESEAPKKNRERLQAAGLILDTEIRGLKVRRITENTCRHFGYAYHKTPGKNRGVYIAPYFDRSGQLVAQKIRGPKKDFKWIGSVKQKDVLPFGAQCWPRTGKRIVVTEGEIDALAMSQVQDNKWPVVSIPTGAGPQVRRYIANTREYWDGFDEVVVMFDQDEPGRDAAEQVAEVLGSKVKIATLPLKDASDMLKEGKTKELITAMWQAKAYRPESIVDLSSLREEVMTPPEMGLSWPFDSLTNATFGIRLGELYALGAGTGVGKTDVYTQIMAHMATKHGVKIGVFSLEQEPKETALRLLGKLGERPFHIPDAGWEEKDLAKVWEQYVEDGKVFFYDSFGVNEWEAIKAKIEYLRDAEGVRYFFLDHLTALAAWQDDERVALEQIMADMGSLVKQVPISIFFVSHLATPEGKPHEEGGRVTIRHFKGSRAIGFWSHFMFGLERDQQADDPRTRHTTTFRILKDRYTGRSTGQTFYLAYDHESGMLFETADPQDGGIFEPVEDEQEGDF